ncbi:MAG: UbiA prenyltransferase family protein, partial [Desulfobacula sp.]
SRYEISENDPPVESALVDLVPELHSCDGAGVGAIAHVLYTHPKIDIYTTIKNYIALMRPKQYLKNGFVFAPLFFALPVGNPEILISAGIAFVLFSLLASAVYIFNDYCDIESDRLHPKKRFRPLASGKVSKTGACILTAGLLAISITGCLAFLNTQVLSLMLLYLSINVIYTVKLKHVSLIDIFIISTGFVIRLFVGSCASGLELSYSIIVMTFLLSLFLAFAKRRDDVLILMETGRKMRKNITGYNLEFINSAMSTISSIILITYIMYTISPEIIAKHQTDKLYLTSLFVILGILRYQQITFIYKNSGVPTEILMKDKFIQLSIGFWIISFLCIKYFRWFV